MRMQTAMIAVVLGCLRALAADPSEAGVPTSPLMIYSGGLSAGVASALNDSLKSRTPRFFKLSFVNCVYLRENIDLFMDIDWFAPGKNFGADMGIDVHPSLKTFVPFAGAGVGAHYFDWRHRSFGDCVGPSVTAHAGFLFDVSGRLQIRVRVPGHIAINTWNDRTLGVDIGFLLSDPLKKVKKLNY